ncbi:MAG: fasciclin domain-containing protein [Prevotella sp.]|nr:fasciclin domain-containing protein [Prevotella sp.]
MRRSVISFAVVALLGLVGCSEKIDDSNLYTFTGETIEDYLVNRSDRFSSFNYILSRIGYDKILSAYGTYTCFAPDNDAVEAYVDSLYDDMSNEQLPHNGMTSRGLEGLTDSLCTDIALFHLLYSEVMGVEMNNGMTISTMLGRDINTSVDSISGQLALNNHSLVTVMDNELENGVLHEINHVLTRSNNLIAGEMEKHPQFSIFLQALVLTGLADSLSAQERKGIVKPMKYTGKGNAKMYTPDVCKVGFTIFAETDEVLRRNGINSFDDLFNYAKSVYEKSADAAGWYDYYRNNGIQVSSGKDYQNPANVLNMFVRYHILRYVLPYNKFFYTYSMTSKALLYEYLETMLPYTLVKASRISGRVLLNRWVANSTLTDRVGEMASDAISTVMQEGIEVDKDNIQSLNGYIHPIDGLLVYDTNVPHGVLNERMRFDDTSFLPELMSNGLRCKNPSEVRAIAGGVYDTFGGNGNIRLPENYCSTMRVYNGDNTEVYYLGGQDCTWANYQGDEILCMGAYDFAFRLPPVPDGTYELRLGYSANGNRGMVQFYMGRNSSVNSMRTLDIPLDMRHVPSNQTTQNNGVTTYSPDAVTGWLPYLSTEDMGVESDANMHSLGWMRGPLCYNYGQTVSRGYAGNLRRIITKGQFEQGDYWLRFKTVLPDNTSTEFHLDYIEFCPEAIYNNSVYAEDMY